MSGARRRPGSAATSRRTTPPQRWGAHELARAWARRIVAAADFAPGDLVVDLGAGRGSLTLPLIRGGQQVLAVELHPGRAAALRSRVGSDATVVQDDMMAMPLPSRPFHVMANPPYGIAAALVRRLTAPGSALRSAQLVLPRWQVNRYLAQPPRHCQVGIGLHVPASAFRPPPRNDSAVLVLHPRHRRHRRRRRRRPRRRP